jgi:hypothetical protein
VLPAEVVRIVILDTLPEPFRTFFTALAERVNRAINRLWVENQDITAESNEIIIDIWMTAPRPRPLGELGQFANDNQNVHRAATVQMVTDVIDRVLKIPVPPEYVGNRTTGEILLHVPMCPESVQWFIKKYYAQEDIYEYGNGIYSRVTNSVWQYIKHSPDKKDLCSIFSTEIKDSIGMCAQGNLTRICNVLAGYLEGVNTETQGEQLQRRMAKLMDLENPEDRIREGKKILEELSVPLAEQDSWIEALS